MGKARDWIPAALTAGALVATGLTLAHSLRVRGGRRTAIFAGLGMGLPLAAEFGGVNLLQVIRHRMHPQIFGVPLAAVSWYNIGYATHALVEGLLARTEMSKRSQRWAQPAGTAAVATSLDLIFDCFGLDLGLWEWREGGPYAQEIMGPNGKAGIPIANFIGWVALTGSVSLGYQLFAGAGTSPPKTSGREERERYVRSGQTAALLLAPNYIASAAWAIRRRRPRYLAYSALFPAAMLASIVRKRLAGQP